MATQYPILFGQDQTTAGDPFYSIGQTAFGKPHNLINVRGKSVPHKSLRTRQLPHRTVCDKLQYCKSAAQKSEAEIQLTATISILYGIRHGMPFKQLCTLYNWGISQSLPSNFLRNERTFNTIRYSTRQVLRIR